jgi:predicted  nucleic acid-binding Zn-ribbon protein
MCKKIAMAATGLCLVLGLFFGRDAASYVGTSVGWVKDSVKEAVPPEFELERARRMVRDLVPDIRKNMHVIAQEEVEVARLEREIAATEEGLVKDKAEVTRLNGDLKARPVSFNYGGRTYTEDQVKRDLKARFDRFRTKEATLESLKEIHEARLTSLQAAQQKLAGMQTSKRQLEVELQNLEARLKMVEAAQTTCDYNFDDSRLSRAKELVGELRTRLEVAQRMVDAEGTEIGEIPLDETASEDIVAEVDDYFSGNDQKVAHVDAEVTE